MKNQFTRRDGLFVAKQILETQRPDVYVDCLLDKDDGEIKSAYGIVYQDFVIELYHLVGSKKPFMKSIYPEFELVYVDSNSGSKRFYKVVFDHEETIKERSEA